MSYHVYADSAIDYKWSVTRIDPASKSMTVQYDPADSTDSARPSIFKNINLQPDEFNDSDIRSKIKTMSRDVVISWDRIIEANTLYPSFNADSYIGVTNTDRYIPTLTPTTQEITNGFTQEYSVVDSSTNDYRRLNYVVTTMSDSAKATTRETFAFDKKNLWKKLIATGYLDDVVAYFQSDSSYANFSAVEYEFLHGASFNLKDSIGSSVQTIVGIPDDSDFTAWLVDY